jgi:hypothetical protein
MTAQKHPLGVFFIPLSCGRKKDKGLGLVVGVRILIRGSLAGLSELF